MRRAGQQAFARGGQLHRARGSHEERVAKDGFQSPDLLGERWLREMEPPRRAAEVQFLGDRDEVAQMSQFQFLIHI